MGSIKGSAGQRVPGFVRTLITIGMAATLAACGGGGGSDPSGGVGPTSNPGNGGPAAGTGSSQIKSVAAISQTRDNTMVVDSDGVLWSRGSNVGGALGIGSGEADVLNLASKTDGSIGTTPVRFEKISSSEVHSLALTATGALWGWGDNSDGQLGVEPAMVVKPMQLATDVVAMAAAGTHSLYVTRSGDLYAMGENQYGQLGTGDRDSRKVATLIGSGFSKVAAGWHFSVAVKDDGTLWTWGGSQRGELGDGRSGYDIAQTTPNQIDTGFIDVFAGTERAFAIRRTGNRLIAWGDNLSGQLGLGTKGNLVATPALVGDDYKAVAGGAGHTLAQKLDGTIQGWGSNIFNQLMLGGSVSEALSPTNLSGTYDFVSAGGGNTLLATRGGMLEAHGASFPNDSIDFPYDPNAGRENTNAPNGGTPGGTTGGGGTGGAGSGTGGSRQDALAYDAITVNYTCKPIGGVSNKGSFPVADGPCKTQQQAYNKAVSCNEYDANFTFNSVGRPFYQCAVNNSSGNYKSAYQKYLDYFSK